MASKLRGMYAMTILDKRTNTFSAIRDHVGIIPLYIGYGSDGSVWIASEMKALAQDCERFEQFPPGHYYSSVTGKLTRWYNPVWRAPTEYAPYDATALRQAFEHSVKQHMMSDVPWGVLLSGGLDSSLVASVASRIMKAAAKDDDREQSATGHAAAWFPRLHSFCIGLENSPDIAAAARVATFLGTVHHSYTYTIQEGLDAIRQVIYHLETYDVTTIRASTPMFLMSRKIKAMGIKMVLSGEGADEVFAGYLYFHKAPNPTELQAELRDKVDRLYLYDNLRANKSTCAWGVEARVPFLSADFLDLALTIDPAEKMISHEKKRIEKHILRQAFDTPEDPYLPADILWRQKEQFSDGVGYGWIDALRDHAELHVSDEMFAAATERFPYNAPTSKEAYLYRAIFEEHYPQDAAQRTVPGGPSIACSTERAIAWDTSFKNRYIHNSLGFSLLLCLTQLCLCCLLCRADCSGRAVTGVHDQAYGEAFSVQAAE